MSYEDKIKEQAAAYMQPGERVIAAFIARPRGASQATMGGLAGNVIGGRKAAQQREAAKDAGLQLASPMALEVKRLLAGKVVTVTVRGTSFKLEVGAGMDTKGVADGFALAKTAV
jgi:hypothetical protein